MPAGLMRVLRTVSLTEGISYLLLLLVAMPMKYFGDMPWAVSYVGMAHGLLFILLWLMVAAAWAKGLPTKLTIILLIASILPAGPFFVDHKLKAFAADASMASPPTV